MDTLYVNLQLLTNNKVYVLQTIFKTVESIDGKYRMNDTCP